MPELKLLVVKEVSPPGKLKPIRFLLLRVPETSALAAGNKLAPAMTASSPLAKTLSAVARRSGLFRQAAKMACFNASSPKDSIQKVELPSCACLALVSHLEGTRSFSGLKTKGLGTQPARASSRMKERIFII